MVIFIDLTLELTSVKLVNLVRVKVKDTLNVVHLTWYQNSSWIK